MVRFKNACKHAIARVAVQFFSDYTAFVGTKAKKAIVSLRVDVTGECAGISNEY